MDEKAARPKKKGGKARHKKRKDAQSEGAEVVVAKKRSKEVHIAEPESAPTPGMSGEANGPVDLLWDSYRKAAIAGKGTPMDRSAFDVPEGSLLTLAPSTSGHTQQQPFDALVSVALGTGWKKGLSPSAYGRPAWLIICASAERCIDILKRMDGVRRLAKVGKLFARHMKVKAQIEFLERTRVGAVIGTPSRMNKLADQGALDLTQLKLVFLDTHTDKKNLSLLTLKDVQVSIDMRTRRSAFVSLPIHVSNDSTRTHTHTRTHTRSCECAARSVVAVRIPRSRAREIRPRETGPHDLALAWRWNRVA